MTINTVTKGFKVISIVNVVLGSLGILAALLYTGMGIYSASAGIDGMDKLVTTLFILNGVLVLLQSDFMLAAGLTGLKALNDLTKLASARMLGIIAAALTFIGLVSAIVDFNGATDIVTALISLTINGLFLYFVTAFKNQNRLAKA